MKVPNTERSAADNVLLFLHTKAGMTTTNKEIVLNTVEASGPVSGAVSRLLARGALSIEKTVNRQSIYLVHDRIKLIQPTGRKRPAYSRKFKSINGSSVGVFKIESGIKLPESYQYPFDEMRKGDSFMFPAHTKGDLKKVQNAVLRYGKKHKVAFAVRRVGTASGRCWRV